MTDVTAQASTPGQRATCTRASVVVGHVWSQLPCHARAQAPPPGGAKQTACSRRKQDQEDFQQFESAGFLHVVESASGPVVLLLGRNFAYASVRHLLPSLQR